MKVINKIIRYKIAEIIFCVLIIVVSFFSWDYIPREGLDIAKMYDRTSLAYVDVSGYQNVKFYPMNDEAALKYLQPMSVSLNNETNINYSYHVGFRVSKDSTLDVNYIKYSIGNDKYLLNEHFYKEDNKYRYYLIDEGEIKASNKMYNIRLWLDENTPEEELGHVFKYSLLNFDNIISV